MDTTTINNKLREQVALQSGLDQHRDYLGISKVGECPRRIVYEYVHGITVTEDAHRFCFAGYEQERSILALLVASGIARPNSSVEVIAPFDPRLRGHVDGITMDDELLEVKSVTVHKFEQVKQSHNLLKKHFVQVQLYMRYGGWKNALVIYRCRETYEHVVVRLPYIRGTGEKLEAKARYLLRCIDDGVLPECECRHCGQ